MLFPIIVFLMVLSPLYIPVFVTAVDKFTDLRDKRAVRPVRAARPVRALRPVSTFRPAMVPAAA